MTTPKLPEPVWAAQIPRTYVYTQDQMLAYAAECVAAERERCARVCDAYKSNRYLVQNELAEVMSDAIRAGADK
jgi:hypothetical protein